MISDKPPATYLPPLIAQHGAQVFDAQAIPTDVSILGVASYKAFLAQRRELIAACLNEFLVPGLTVKNPAAIQSSQAAISET
jgi:hypothetical protein